ncbi:hypothetical protein B0H11DRAFT_2294000 [Mycena galericulata]|nr:hypothetical protein B0H11DRAFT_2294000 [Mycena galericulata]
MWEPVQIVILTVAPIHLDVSIIFKPGIYSLSFLSYELQQRPLTLMSSIEPGLTIGSLQIGVLISYVLFGVTTTQAYIYYGNFPGDSLRLKLLVAFVWFCELAHVVCIGHTLYVMTISDYGQPERLVHPPQTLPMAVIFSCAISASVQGFFAWRIYRFSERLYIPCLSWILTVVRLVCSLRISVAGLHMSTFPDFEAQMSRLLVTTWIVSATNDLLIAISLVYFLYRQRTTARTRTVALIDKLIAWTIGPALSIFPFIALSNPLIETGVLTRQVTILYAIDYTGLTCLSSPQSSVGIATLILFLKQPNNFAWLACFAVGARLFANSLLAKYATNIPLLNKTNFQFADESSLNSRTSLRAQNGTIGHFSSRELMSQFDLPTTVEVEMSKATRMQLAFQQRVLSTG